MKKLKGRNIQIWTPNRKSFEELRKKTTHLGVCAHSDDLEVIAFDGIVKHFKDKRSNFFGIVVSDNQGKPIHPKYKSFSLSKVQKIREEEQIKAARLGEYAGLAFLRYPSSKIKDAKYKEKIKEKIKEVVDFLRPSIVYTHSLFDRHLSHVAVTLRAIEALRGLNKNKRPDKLYGVEVWGGLDWLSQKRREVFDVSGYEELSSKLLRVFKSQRFGLHRYDVAFLSRMKSNAVYYKTHQFSKSTSLIFAMDLTQLVKNKRLSIKKYLKSHINAFSDNVFRRFKVVIPILLLAFILAGCAASNYNVRLKRNTLGLEMPDERKIGIAASKYVESEYRIIEDGKINDGINKIGQKLAKVCERPLIGYNFKILDTDEFNAMSLPDGYVYIFKGLIDLAGDNEKIAAVLAHEIAHTSRSHAMKRLYAMKDQQAMLLGLSVGVSAVMSHEGTSQATRGEASRLIRLGAQISQMILYTGYSQSAEREADRLGMVYMKRAGYNPEEFVEMLKKLKQVEKETPNTGIFRTHPKTQVRTEEAKEFLKILPNLIKNQKLKSCYIGAEFKWDYDKERPVVINIIKNSPADKTELRLTDIVLEINGHSTDLRCRGDFELLMRDTIKDEFKKGKCNMLIKRGSHAKLIDIKPEKIYEDPEVLKVRYN